MKKSLTPIYDAAISAINAFDWDEFSKEVDKIAVTDPYRAIAIYAHVANSDLPEKLQGIRVRAEKMEKKLLKEKQKEQMQIQREIQEEVERRLEPFANKIHAEVIKERRRKQ